MKQEKQIADIIAHLEKMRAAAEYKMLHDSEGIDKAFWSGKVDALGDTMQFITDMEATLS